MSNDENGIISVRGVGRIALPPNQISVAVCVKSEDMDYKTAVMSADDEMKKLTAAALSAGFSSNDMKTTNISVDCRYDYMRGDDGQQIREFRGYVYSQHLTVTFSLDMTKLASLLNAISACGSSPELSVSFGLHDQNQASEQLMKSMAIDAKRKAEVLANASNMSLGKLKSITYGSDSSQPRNYVLSGARANSIADSVPEDIILSDSAEFVWELISIHNI